MVMSRAIIRDLYPRERVGGMISLVIAVMMIAQLLSPLIGGSVLSSSASAVALKAVSSSALAISGSG